MIDLTSVALTVPVPPTVAPGAAPALQGGFTPLATAAIRRRGVGTGRARPRYVVFTALGRLSQDIAGLSCRAGAGVRRGGMGAERIVPVEATRAIACAVLNYARVPGEGDGSRGWAARETRGLSRVSSAVTQVIAAVPRTGVSSEVVVGLV